MTQKRPLVNPSRTMKQEKLSSIDQGGGKRRGTTLDFGAMPRAAYDPQCDALSFCGDIEPPLHTKDRPQGQATVGHRDGRVCMTAI